MSQAPEAPSGTMLEEMFVHTARSVSSDQVTITLHGLTPSTLYFSDRPERVVGHMSTAQFVEMWAQGPNSFQEDPPIPLGMGHQARAGTRVGHQDLSAGIRVGVGSFLPEPCRTGRAR